MRPSALLVCLGTILASLLMPVHGAVAAVLDLPVARDGANVSAPFYRGDVLELRLAPSAARALLPRGAGATRALARGRTGVTRLDAVAASVGATAFQPEFPGETPPSDETQTDFTAFQLVHLAPGADLAGALDAFRALPEVRSADPIAVLPVSALPNDSLTFATWWLFKDQLQRTDIRAPEAWTVERGDTGIVVGVIDTGVIPFHPDLGGRAGERGNLYVNWAERAGRPGVDDDGNGYVDDFGGWDFVVLGTNAAAGEDGRNEDNDPNDWGGHGTACAGIIGAIQGNGIGLAGVVPRVRIMPLRIGWLQSGVIPPAGVIDMSYAAAAIRYATRMGVQVVNCSWQSQNTGGLDAAVAAATRAGMIVVNASGNFGTPFTYLGQRDDVIAVTATDSTDVVWTSAVRGPWVDLAAAGVSITSTMFQRLSATDSIVGRTPAYKGFMSGTSFAAPQVAGAVALLQAQRLHAGLDPLTPMGANLRLRDTADDLSATNPAITDYGAGRLDLFRALADPPRSLAVRTRARSVGASLTLRDDRGVARVITAFNDRTIIASDGVTGDTLWTQLLPSAPASHLAAVQLPPPYGVVIASGSTTGVVTLLHDDGSLVAGWPRTTATGFNLTPGVCFTDLDGDGIVEVVAVGTSISATRIWAWGIDGTPRAGFPFDFGTGGQTAVTAAVAAADLDGVPGDELAFLDANNALRVVRGNGVEAPGFPTAPVGSSGRAPVIARLGGPGTPPSIVVASINTITAFAPDGSTRWTSPYGGVPTQDPVLADLDGDGVDEVVVATVGPNSLVACDSSGAAFTARPGWPIVLSTTPVTGPLVVGPLTLGGGLAVMGYTTPGLVAWTPSGQPVKGFPRPGGAGVLTALDDLDGDGATEVAAGTSLADSNQYTYDAGPGTFAASALAWPTARGGPARTASHAKGAPSAFVIDRTPPARIPTFSAEAITNTSVKIRFTHTGNDGAVGTAARLELRTYQGPLDDGNFALLGTLVPSVPPQPSGTPDSVVVTGLAEGRTHWFAMRAFDRFEQGSVVSASDSASLPGVSPGGVRDLRASAADESTVVLTWLASGGDGDTGRALRYRIAGSPAPLDSAGFGEASLQRLVDATRDAGLPETLRVTIPTAAGRWRFAIIAVDAAFLESPMSNVAEAFTKPPARISTLSVEAITNTSIKVRFTHTGENGAVGTAARLELRTYQGPLDDGNFALFGTLVPSVPPQPSGTPDSVVVTGLAEGRTHWFAMRAFDRFEQGSIVSASDSASLLGVAPGGVRDLRASAVDESTVVLTWLASGGDGDTGRPLRYRIAGSPAAFDSAGFGEASLQRLVEATRDAGLPETLRVTPLTAGRRWRFAVIAVDGAFSESPMSNVAEAVTSVGGAIAGRVGLALASRPLPAVAEVTVDWQGDPSGTVEQWLEVHDLAGRLRRRVAVGHEPGGAWQWNGRDEEGVLVPAGLYFVRLVSGSRHATSRVVFVR